VTLTVEASHKGRLSGHGIGLGWTSRRVTKTGNVTLKLHLTKYGKRLRARRHHRHKHLKVKVTVRLAGLKAGKKVTFR
jgi:hypothetical protein